jgi:Ca2+-binding RTX toxin-like protein
VNVNVVEFWGDNNQNSGWNDSDSYTYNHVSGTSGTDIEQGLRSMYEQSYSGNQPTADQNVMYFIGDGNTYGDYQADFNAFLPTWEAFIGSGEIDKLFTYSVETSAVLRDLTLLSVPGEDVVSDEPVNVADIGDLSTFLVQTVSLYNTGSINVLSEGAGELDSGVIFGADGGHIESVAVNGTTYSYDSANPVQDIVGTFGVMQLDFNTGDYTYELAAPATGLIGVESMAFDYVDGDGDTASAEIDFYVTQYGETVGTALDDMLLGDDANDLLYGLAGNDEIAAGGEDDFVKAGAGDDTVTAGSGDDVVVGGDGNDQIDGGSGNDILVGGADNDILVGDSGADTLVWRDGDQGEPGSPAEDVVLDFNRGDGDVLDLADLLTGENGGNLTEYLHFEAQPDGDGGINTVLQISSDGNFNNGNYDAVDQTIVLNGVDLVADFGSDQAIIDALLNTNLVTD